jgi:hypothetical protein
MRESVDLRTETTIPGSFAAVSLNMHTSKTKFRRNYYKGQNMLADLGGLLKGIITLATLINYYFTDKNYYSDIINQNIDSLTENEKKSELIQSKKKSIETLGVISGTRNNKLNSISISPHGSPLKSKLRDGEDNNTKRTVGSLNLSPSESKKLNRKISKIPSSNSIINPKSDKKKLINFSFAQLVLPAFCFSSSSESKKGLNNFNKLKNKIRAQIDISHIIRQSNTVDKISFILCGENRNLIEKCVNPAHYDEKNLPQEFNLIQNKIIRRLSGFELKDKENN